MTVDTKQQESRLTLCKCGEQLAVEKWFSSGELRVEQRETLSVRSIKCPAWAARYALQGVDAVSRYFCRACGKDRAILAWDLPASEELRQFQ